jgi:hypothetical protein
MDSLTHLFVGGAIAAAIGIQAVYYLGGALLLLAAVIGWAGLRGQTTSPTPARFP